ncbi:MAG: ATP-dependent zinc metalloprotease FtsH, partial [Proteobacteria bacterium]|nr:ATP-dependent zinc metalloprotease FtsH [Pseudomonadota bacterium]
ILVVGPPGTGKTLLARAVAGEAGVPFFRISGSDFVEMFVGVGASRVRDLFEQGKKRAPCIIFIDEIDAVGRLRGSGLGGGHDEREQTLNQLLVEMDGFDGDSGIILMAATNRPDVLDPALLRPGRFDRQVFVDKPDLQGREAILKVHTRNIPLKPDVDLRELARGTPGFSGADLENLANEAALCAARNNADAVGRKDLEFAKDKVLMGAERKSMILGKDEKERIAYHESGHAVMARHARHADDVHKVSIIPRNRSLGVTITLPKGEKRNLTEQQLRDDIKVLYAGRVAEEMKYGPGNTSIGAGNDIERSTDIIRAMVTEWGFSEELGPLRYIDKQQNVFLGGSMGQQQNVSSETAREIDLEMRRIAVEEIKNVRTLLREKNREVEAVAQALIEHETLDSVDIEDVLAGRPVVRNDIKMPERAPPAAPQQSGAAYDLPPP